jgi:hypothetical protein
MPSISTRKTARKLVLGRETVRTLTALSNTTADATPDGRASSCIGQCACTDQMQTY